MSPLTEAVAEMGLDDLRALVDEQTEGQPINKTAGLPEAIRAAAPPGQVTLLTDPNEAGWIPVSASPVDKADYPELDKVYAAAGYPWGSSATTMNLPPIDGTEPDANLVWAVKT